jgi:hypothetical protein
MTPPPPTKANYVEKEDTPESIHRSFLESSRHQLPVLRSSAVAASSLSNHHHDHDDFSKHIYWESLKRRRIGLYASLQEQHVRQCQFASLHHDLSARRRRFHQQLLLMGRRPYLRFLSLPALSSSAGTRRRTGGRRSVEILEACLFDDEAPPQEESGIAAAEKKQDGSDDDHGPSPPPQEGGSAFMVGEEIEYDDNHLAQRQSRVRLSRMQNASYRLLTGTSVSLEDEGKVLVLQLEDDDSEFPTASLSSVDADAEASTSTSGRCSYHVFLQFVVATGNDRSTEVDDVELARGSIIRRRRRRSRPSAATVAAEQDVVYYYYLRLHSHTFPKPLAPLVKRRFGCIRLGTIGGNGGVSSLLASPSSSSSSSKKPTSLSNRLVGRKNDSYDDEDGTLEQTSCSPERLVLDERFLKGLREGCRDLKRALAEHRARAGTIDLLLALDRKSQRRRATMAASAESADVENASPIRRSKTLHLRDDSAYSRHDAADDEGTTAAVPVAVDEEPLISRRKELARRKKSLPKTEDGSDEAEVDSEGNDDDDANDDDDDDDEDEDDDGLSQATTVTALSEYRTRDDDDGSGSTREVVSYHYVGRMSVDDEQIRFRLHCCAPEAPTLVVTIHWPEQTVGHSPCSGESSASALSPPTVTLAYHARSKSDRSRANRASRIMERKRERRLHLRQQKRKRRRQVFESNENAEAALHATEMAVVAASSDDDEVERGVGAGSGSDDDDGDSRGDPYLQALERVANRAFRDRPIGTVIERLVSKMKELLDEDYES